MFQLPIHDGQAWILITTGGVLNLSNVTIDGSGFSIFRAMIFNGGSGTINSIAMQNILHTNQYLGLGVSVQGTSSASVTNSTFNNIGRIGVHFRGPGVTGTYSGNTYTGKGAGDFLDYGVEFGGARLAQSVVTILAITMV